jgi:hypothetical protein
MPRFDDQTAQLNIQYSNDPEFAPPARWTRYALLRQQERAVHRLNLAGLRERCVEKRVVGRGGRVQSLVVTVVNEREGRLKHQRDKTHKNKNEKEIEEGKRWKRRQQFVKEQRAARRSACSGRGGSACNGAVARCLSQSVMTVRFAMSQPDSVRRRGR